MPPCVYGGKKYNKITPDWMFLGQLTRRHNLFDNNLRLYNDSQCTTIKVNLCTTVRLYYVYFYVRGPAGSLMIVDIII